MLPIEKRTLITIQGRVQGVGFRPFVYRLAHACNLVGSVKNTTTGVVIDVQGGLQALEKFQKGLFDQKPEQAFIDEYFVQDLFLGEERTFQIADSALDSNRALALLPDTAICDQCREELIDPGNRRYHYPFLHCVSCGPRFSLFLGMPFDRENTTMRDFKMCGECEGEYKDPGDRRFHSQTNCCPQCGPQLRLVDVEGKLLAVKEEIFPKAAQMLHEGKILAMKNTGGYLLLADAANNLAVMRMRRRKRRPNKPFAVLFPSFQEVEQCASLSRVEKSVLRWAAAPIVLLRKKVKAGEIAPSVSPQSPYLGAMLPHNPIQILLQKSFSRPLVATSGNVSGIPLCITEEEAFANLSGIADGFLIHDRRISHRLDDSVVQVMACQPVVLRKARGLVPDAISLAGIIRDQEELNLFAAGGHMKNSFAFGKKRQIYMSQYMGDLTNSGQCLAYETEVAQWKKLLGIEKVKSVGDLHPDYSSSLYLYARDTSYLKVQHHEAHVWSGMADCRLSPPFLGIAWDGTGWGGDGTIWGGEAFVVSEASMERVASLFPFRLPGGERAVSEPRRSMLGVIDQLFPSFHRQLLSGMFSREELLVLSTALHKGINSPICSSVGRLFDAISAILKLCKVSDYEGQGAQMLENAAYDSKEGANYSFSLFDNGKLILLDWRPMVREVLTDLGKDVPISDIAMGFHEALADAVLQLAVRCKLERVLLTGGVMQNKLLVEKIAALLKRNGFVAYLHRTIPPNDSGIAVGQAVGTLRRSSSSIKVEKSVIQRLSKKAAC